VVSFDTHPAQETILEPFNRRTYQTLGQLLRDVRAIVSRRGEMRQLMRGESLSPAFRERLMLAVTEVNQCRHCSYYHARQALAEGLTQDEITALSEGEFDNSPAQERPALLYAQHWAEANGAPDPAARARIAELYGPQTANAIDLALTVIRIGNLGGNTLDGLLHWISRGRWATLPSDPGSRL